MYKFDQSIHAHTLDGKALLGTSTIVGVLSKPLTYWASGLAVAEFGWKNPKITSKEDVEASARAGLAQLKSKKMTVGKYIEKLNAAYRAHATSLTKSADKGTDMHAILEEYVKACTDRGAVFSIEHGTTDHAPLQIFSDWAFHNVEKFYWSEMNVYSKELWVGGISDVGAQLKDGTNVIIDFKSSKEAYDSQFIQIGGYDLQQAENGGFNSQGKQTHGSYKIGAYIVFPFGAVNPEPVVRYNVAQLKDMFRHCTELYRFINSNNTN